MLLQVHCELCRIVQQNAQAVNYENVMQKMKMPWLFFLIFVSKIAFAGSSESKVLKTEAGTFNGTVRQVDAFGETKNVEKFLEIRCAEPVQRFRKPVIN